MKVLLFIALCAVIAVSFYGIGVALGNWIGKRQKMQNEVKQNGSKHV